MKGDIASLRNQANKIDDIEQRGEVLRDLAELEKADFDLQRRLAEIDCEHWKKWRAYKPPSRLRLLFFAVSSALLSILSFFFLIDVLESGTLSPPKSGRIITVAASPTEYWLYLGLYVLGEVMFVLGAIGCVVALVKYPHPPFKWMSRKPASCK